MVDKKHNIFQISVKTFLYILIKQHFKSKRLVVLFCDSARLEKASFFVAIMKNKNLLYFKSDRSIAYFSKKFSRQ